MDTELAKLADWRMPPDTTEIFDPRKDKVLPQDMKPDLPKYVPGDEKPFIIYSENGKRVEGPSKRKKKKPGR